MGRAAVLGWLRRQRDSGPLLGNPWGGLKHPDHALSRLPCILPRQKTFGIESTGEAPRPPLASGGNKRRTRVGVGGMG